MASNVEAEHDSNRVRKPNWSEEETLALAKASAPYAKILDGSVKVPPLKKFAIWQHITQEVNIVGGSRSIKEVQTKHKNVKSSGKSKEVHNRMESGKTGGGPSNVQNLSAAEELLVSTIGEASLTGIIGGIDINEKDVPPPCKVATLGMPQQQRKLSIEKEVVNDLAESLNVNESHPPPKRARKSFEKSPTEDLLERQVNLLQEQVMCFKKMIKLMEVRNNIEEAKCRALQKKILLDIENVD